MMLSCGFVGDKDAGLVCRTWLKGATETFPTSAVTSTEGGDHTLLFYTGRSGRRLGLEVQCPVTIE